MSHPTQTVDVLLLPQSNLILLSALTEPLRAANRLLGESRFSTRLWSLDGQSVDTTAGFAVPVSGRFDPDQPEPLLVAASYGVERFIPALRHPLSRAMRCRPFIAAADGGVLLLAEAGLYNGYQAALHAEDVEMLGARCQAVRLSRRRWVIDRDRASARGSGSAIEMMLSLIERWADRSLAESVARLFDFVPADSIGAPRDTTRGLRDDRVARVLDAMASHLSDPLSVEQLAALINVTRRGLHDLFNRELGTSPQAAYVQCRLERARQLLVESDRPIADIAQQCGYAHTASFSKAYRTAFGCTPRTSRQITRVTAFGLR